MKTLKLVSLLTNKSILTITSSPLVGKATVEAAQAQQCDSDEDETEINNEEPIVKSGME